MRIYLAGTITRHRSTHVWRERAVRILRNRGHIGLNPMRRKNPGALSPDGLKANDITPQLFVERDEKDIKSSDAVIFYTLGVEKLPRQSIGTWAELGLARAYRKPIIVVADHRQVVEYPFIVKWAAAIVPTLEDGIDKALWLDD